MFTLPFTTYLLLSASMLIKLSTSVAKYISIIVIFAIIFILFNHVNSTTVFSYDQLGGGICECNTCGDCTTALTDDVNCAVKVKLTADVVDEAGNCINEPDGTNKIFDCQNHTIDGQGFANGVVINTFSGGNYITIKNCNISDFGTGIALNGGTYTVQNNTLTSNYLGIELVSNTDVTVTGNTVTGSLQYGIYAGYNALANISNNTVNNTIFAPTTYHVYQLVNGNWNELQELKLTPEYQTKQILVQEKANTLTMRLEQTGTSYGDIEKISLNACGREIAPSYARYVESGEDILLDIIENDLNVIISHDKLVEVSWDMPLFCTFPQVVNLTANEYPKGLPMKFPDSSNAEFISYGMGANTGAMNVDGVITNEDDISKPLFSEIWSPTSGHPEGTTYMYVKDDKESVYISFDVTADNTNEYGEDWMEVEIRNTKGEIQKFHIDDFAKKYGECGFGLTDMVAYKHQMCEFVIPKSEIGYDDFEFRGRYYGTLALIESGSGIYVADGHQTINGNEVSSNSNYGVVINSSGGLNGFSNGGINIAIDNNTACSNTTGDIYGYDLTPTVSGDNNECDSATDWDDAGTTGCTYVCDDTPPVFVQLPGSQQIINLTTGQVVTVNPYTIKVKPEDPESGITRVEFYIDGELICTVTTPDANGVYSCDWDTAKYHSDIYIAAYNGNALLGELNQTAFVALPETGQNITVWLVLGNVLILGSLIAFRGKPNLKKSSNL